MLFLAALLALVAFSARADVGILWFNAETNRITYGSGGTDYLSGNRLDASLGCFLQLIMTGPDGLINPARDSGDGTTGDDTVIATAWFGMDIFSADRNGWVNNSTVAAATSGAVYYARAWSAPSPDYLNGLVPTSATNRYGDSATWLYPGAGSPPQDQIFNFGGAEGFSTTLQAVPEPGVSCLFAVGTVLFARRVLKRRERLQY